MLNKRGMIDNKKGQVTIFIIVAILIIVIGALIYILSPGLRSSLGQDSKNPYDFIKTCLEEDIENNIQLISSQGGYLEPEAYYLYADSKLAYLCYINEYYKPCIMQQPLLNAHMENEIKNSIEGLVDQCFYAMRESFEKKGYDVDLKEGNVEVEILPDNVNINFVGYESAFSKGEVERYDQFKVELLDNNLYELLSIANSILDWEIEAGDVETTAYLYYYPHIKVEKKKQIEGTTVYIVTDRNSQSKFQFVSRSFAWPAGYPQ